jgi:hypothetical protein
MVNLRLPRKSHGYYTLRVAGLFNLPIPLCFAFGIGVSQKFSQVKQKLENGLAVLIYDDEMETTNIFRHDDPVLRKLDK